MLNNFVSYKDTQKSIVWKLQWKKHFFHYLNEDFTQKATDFEM